MFTDNLSTLKVIKVIISDLRLAGLNMSILALFLFFKTKSLETECL